MRKFTHEELSRVLSMHDVGGLSRGSGAASYYEGQPVCLVQAAYNDHAWWGRGLAFEWFDDNYDPTWTPDEFVEALDKAGLVKGRP